MLIGPPESPTVENLHDARTWLEDVEGDFCFGYGDLQEIYPEIPMAHPWQIRYDPSAHILSV